MDLREKSKPSECIVLQSSFESMYQGVSGINGFGIVGGLVPDQSNSYAELF